MKDSFNILYYTSVFLVTPIRRVERLLQPNVMILKQSEGLLHPDIMRKRAGNLNLNFVYVEQSEGQSERLLCPRRHDFSLMSWEKKIQCSLHRIQLFQEKKKTGVCPNWILYNSIIFSLYIQSHGKRDHLMHLVCRQLWIAYEMKFSWGITDGHIEEKWVKFSFFVENYLKLFFYCIELIHNTEYK